MEQNAKPNRLPLGGMLLTTALVLGALYALHWWTDHRSEVYTRRALTAGGQGDWAQAEVWGEKAEAAGAADVLDRLSYDRAAALLEAGDYDAARSLFAQLGDYEDAPRQAMACAYRQAEALEAAGELAAARDAFLAVAGYEDALLRADRCRYALAEGYLATGDLEAAFQGFLELGDYEDAPRRARAVACALTGQEDEELALLYAQGYTPEVLSLQEQLNEKRSTLQSHRLAAGRGHALFLTEGGRVQAAGDNDLGQCEVSGWTDVVAVAAGYAHSLGLTADGRVLAAGDNSCGQCDVSGWINVRSIFCGPWDSYAITRDGALLHCGYRDLSALSGWRGIAALDAGDGVLYALRENGSLLSSAPDQVQTWRDLCAVAAAGYAPVGLRQNGALLSPHLDLSDWTEVAAIHSSATLLLGLRLDGTLLVRPLLPTDESLLNALSTENDVVGLSAAGTYVLLLHADGSLTAPGAPDAIQTLCRRES